MRQKNFTAILIAIVIAIAVIIPSMAFARERPRLNHQPKIKYSDIITRNSVAKKQFKYIRDNRFFRWNFYRNRYRELNYYTIPFYSSYFYGPGAYRWNAINNNHNYVQNNLKAVASDALDAAYQSYMKRQQKH